MAHLVRSLIRVAGPVDVILAVGRLSHRVGDIFESERLNVTVYKENVALAVVARSKILGIGFRAAIKSPLQLCGLLGFLYASFQKSNGAILVLDSCEIGGSL